jgi:hypothetical protein
MALIREARGRQGAVLLVAWLVWAAVAGAGAEPRQIWAGLQANWTDGQTWSTYLEASRETELGLGLQLTGPSGTVPIAFLGRLSVRDPRVPPREIQVQAAVGYLGNPNVIRTSLLTLLADAKTNRRLALDLTARLVVDDQAPGGIIQNGLATIRSAELARLAEAETLSGNVLGFEVFFRPDQIRALRAFAERLHLAPAAPRG